MLYGDISPRTAGYVTADLLTRAQPFIVLEKFAQTKPLPTNSTKSMVFRRYNALPNTPVALSEGVTPAGKTLTKTDITVTLQQYGDWVGTTDVIMDTHEDPVLQESTRILGEQAAQMMELVRYNVLKAGSAVFYANGSARNAVNTVISTTMQRRVLKELKRQNAKPITSVVRSTPSYGTVNVKGAYIAVGHSDIQANVEDMVGFKAVENYGTLSPYENEVGAVGEARYLTSTLFAPFVNAGGASGTTFESDNGTACNVYPVLYLGTDAWATVPLKGKSAITPIVVNPKPVQGDELGQRGSVGWKTYNAAVILNDAWMARGEVAVTK